MRVGILGSGLMGGKLGTLFARAGRVANLAERPQRVGGQVGDEDHVDLAGLGHRKDLFAFGALLLCPEACLLLLIASLGVIRQSVCFLPESLPPSPYGSISVANQKHAIRRHFSKAVEFSLFQQVEDRFFESHRLPFIGEVQKKAESFALICPHGGLDLGGDFRPLPSMDLESQGHPATQPRSAA